MEERNKSLEPNNVPQKDVRGFRKEEEVAAPPEAGLPEQIEIEADKDILGQMAVIAEAEAAEPAPELEPLEAPEISEPEVPVIIDEPGNNPTAKVMEDMAAVAKAEAPKPRGFKEPPAPKVRARNPREAHAMRLAAKRAQHGQAMVDLGNKANEKEEAAPVAPEMPKGEAEQLHFPPPGGADAVTEAYKRYIEADKQRWATLVRLLTDVAMEITFSRQELDQIRGLLERERI